MSNPSKISLGVPQGTILGPVLFLIYINDMFLREDGVVMVSYADDTVIYETGNTWEEVCKKVSKTLSLIKDWLDHNHLHLNISKTNFLCFSSNIRKHPSQLTSLKIHIPECHQNNCTCSMEIQKVHFTKYLGLFLDENLNWSKHTSNLCSKIRNLYYIFHTVKNLVDLNTCRTIYFSLIQSLLTYGLLSWGLCHEASDEQYRDFLITLLTDTVIFLYQ